MDVNLDIVWRNSRERFAITDHCIGNAGHGDMMASSSPPLSVKLIAILYACTMPIVVLKTWAALGDLYARQSVGGWVSLLFHVLLIGFYFYLVNGLWKLRETCPSDCHWLPSLCRALWAYKCFTSRRIFRDSHRVRLSDINLECGNLLRCSLDIAHAQGRF